MQNIFFIIKKYWVSVVLFILILFACVMSGYSIYLQKMEPKEIKDEIIAVADNGDSEEKTDIYVAVDIKGNVKKPGVYQVKEGTIINDVIALAGGFTKNAYVNNINLSKKVSDEMVIYVYSKNEVKDDKKQTVCKTDTVDISDCTNEKVSVIETGTNTNTEEKTTSSDNQLVNINTASESELTTVSGIGSSKAKAIIEYRNNNGSFSNIKDLLNVSGIGEALFEKIKEFITV